MVELPDDVHERLRRSVVIWLTTVSPAGQPQSSPVWFLLQDGHIVVYSLAGAPRVRNIRANPRVALNLDGDGEGGDIVTLEGIAALDDGGPRSSDIPAYQARYAAMIAAYRWTPQSFARDYPQRIVITPSRLRTY